MKTIAPKPQGTTTTRERACVAQSSVQYAGQWLIKDVLYAAQRPLFYLPQMSSVHSFLRSNSFLQMFGRHGWF